MQSDVLIIGAGIGGAALALALGSRGVRVKVLEREAQATKMIRPEVLWGATPRALERFGLGDVLRNQCSVPLQSVQIRRAKSTLLQFSQRTLQRANVEAFSTDPSATRAAIAAAASATGNVEFQHGVDVKQVLKADDRLVGVQAIREGANVEERARLIVGDDGAHSVVRRAFSRDSGDDVKFNLFPLEFTTAGFAWPNELPPNQARVWLNPGTFRAGIPAAGFIPWPNGRGVLLLPLPLVRSQQLWEGTAEEFWTSLAQVTPLTDELARQLKFPDDFRRVKRPYGHVPQYVVDGAAILGDAAHPVSPAGGQGANASIWDALTLADVAHNALASNDLSRQRLAQYETLRRPRNRASVRITEQLVRVLNTTPYIPGLRWLVPQMLRCLNLVPWLQGRVIGGISRTFVTPD